MAAIFCESTVSGFSRVSGGIWVGVGLDLLMMTRMMPKLGGADAQIITAMDLKRGDQCLVIALILQRMIILVKKVNIFQRCLH